MDYEKATENIKDTIKKLHNDGTLHLGIEIPEHAVTILKKSGIDFDNLSDDEQVKFLGIVDKCLEDEFNCEIEAGYFVTETFKPVSKKKLISLFESVITEKYSWQDDDDDDDDYGDYASTYNKDRIREIRDEQSSIETRKTEEPFFSEPKVGYKIIAWNDDRTEKIVANRVADHFGGPMGAYHGSHWNVYVYQKRGSALVKGVEKTVEKKIQVINIIKKMDDYTKAKELIK